MALPPLEHQIRFVDTILLARVQEDDAKRKVYKIEEIMKARYPAPGIDSFLNVDLTIFELLGYSISPNQQVVVFLAAKKDSYDCIDLLVVSQERVSYGKSDPSVFKELTLPELRQLISLHPD